jgi:tetratricopeptide (TPR) repeat protein
MALSVRWCPPLRATALRLLAVALLGLPTAVTADEAETGWTEVRTPHVLLRTDLHPSDALSAAVLAEQTRAAILSAAWPKETLPQPDLIELVVFADHRAFVRNFGDIVVGVFTHIDYLPTVFLYGTSEKWERHFGLVDPMRPPQRGLVRSPCRRDGAECRVTLEQQETTSVLRHELAHHLAAFFYRRQPRWFSEGLAQYLETMRISDDGKSFILGDINPLALREYYRLRSLSVADALAWGGTLNPADEGTRRGLYGLSWLMVHWMFNTHPVDFARFRSLLSKGLDPDKAWKAAFPTLQPAELDKQLFHFARYGEYETTSVPVSGGSLGVDAHSMPPAEVHAARAAASWAAGHEEDVRSELSSALAEDGGNVRALRLEVSMVPPTERVALGERATQAHPEDGLAWLTLGDALRAGGQNGEGAAQAYQKAHALLPSSPAALNGLASVALQVGRPADALPLAVDAVRMAPGSSAILDTLATTLASLGRCSEAIPTEMRALDVLSEGSGPAEQAQYAARLAAMKKHCNPPPASPADPSLPVPGASNP